MNDNKLKNLKSGRRILKTVILLVIIVAIVLLAVKHKQKINKEDKLLYSQEYEPEKPGMKGDIDVDFYEKKSKKFAIGANSLGYPVFKNPDTAFEELQKSYADGIKLIQEEFGLEPLTKENYTPYENLGWQVTTGTEKAKEQAYFVSDFLDIYENSYESVEEYLWAVVDGVTETELQGYVVEKEKVAGLDDCEEEPASQDIIEIQYEGKPQKADSEPFSIYSVKKLSEDRISELVALSWKYEENGEDGKLYKYAIVDSIFDLEVLACDLKSDGRNQIFHMSKTEVWKHLESGDELEKGSIIRIGYIGSEYDKENNEISFDKIDWIQKIY